MNDELKQAMARAICKSRTCEGIACCEWPAQQGRLSCPVRNGGYDDAAQAALDAIEAQGFAVVKWPPTPEQFERAYHDTNWPKPTTLPRKQTLREFCGWLIQAGKVE